MGYLPSALSDDCAPGLTATRVRALVLVDIRLSVGTVVMARRRSPVPSPVGNPSSAAAPLKLLPNLVPLLGWRIPLSPLP